MNSDRRGFFKRLLGLGALVMGGKVAKALPVVEVVESGGCGPPIITTMAPTFTYTEGNYVCTTATNWVVTTAWNGIDRRIA